MGLMATVRSSWVLRASYTFPIRPAPIAERISEGPGLEPAARGSGGIDPSNQIRTRRAVEGAPPPFVPKMK